MPLTLKWKQFESGDQFLIIIVVVVAAEIDLGWKQS